MINPISSWARSQAVNLSDLLFNYTDPHFQYAATNPQLRTAWNELRAARAVIEAVVDVSKSRSKHSEWLELIQPSLIIKELAVTEMALHRRLLEISKVAPQRNSDTNIADIKEAITTTISAQLVILSKSLTGSQQ